jgi:beta-glucosidase
MLRTDFVKIYIITLLALFSIVELNAQNLDNPNRILSIDDRVDSLLSLMTLSEKVGQMTQADHAAVSNLEDVKTYFLGSILSGGGSDPSSGNTALDWTNLYDSFQQKALQTRLGIPIIYGIDAVHGHSNVYGAVIFPHNIGLGATRNPELVENAARVTAVEIAATGIDWTFAPCIAVPRDERWGRTYEGFGETAELASLIGSAAVRGFQNDSLIMPTSIVACAKHYVGDGGTTGGDDQGNTELTEEELRAIHLPGYVTAIENDVKTIMASYNSWNGTKLHGHSYLLNDVLKDELGFQGFIVSDWAAIDQLPGDYASDVETSINAGIDMVMVPNNYNEFFNTLISLVQQNKVSIDRVNDAVRRILKVKFELGLFERPCSLLSLVGSSEHRDVARQCVRESQILLKKNDKILPLPKSNIKVLVAGEHADNIGLQCGGWTIQWGGGSGDITEGTTILEGLQKIAPNVDFVYDANGNFDNFEADYALVVVGEQPYVEGGGDSDDLTLKKSQIQLVRKFKKMGIPVITILISGRPMIINSELHNSDALFAAWLPGTEGDGIAELLFGNYEPTGTLPITWQKSMDDIPMNFGDQDYDPLFEYGFGITSYEDSQVGSAPVLNSALLAEEGNSIELSFNKSMNNSGNTQANISVIKDGSVSIGVTNFELSSFDENIILLHLDEVIEKNASLTVSYLSGNLASEDGGVLNFFMDQPVINFRGSGFHILPGKVEAEDYSEMNGIQTENTTDIGGGLNVGWIDDNDWLEYNCEIQYTGLFSVNFRVASESQGGIIKFLLNGEEKFNQSVPVTGGWQSWITVSNFIDLESGQDTIRLFAQQGGFNINWFELVLLTEVEDENLINKNFELCQNYPNPFNPTTTINYSIPQNDFVKLSIYDMLGKEIETLVDEEKPAGNHRVDFNGSKLSSGIYFYQLNAGLYMMIKKMILLK